MRLFSWRDISLPGSLVVKAAMTLQIFVTGKGRLSEVYHVYPNQIIYNNVLQLSVKDDFKVFKVLK